MERTEREKRATDDEREAELLLEENGEVMEEPRTQVEGVGKVASQQRRQRTTDDSR